MRRCGLLLSVVLLLSACRERHPASVAAQAPVGIPPAGATPRAVGAEDGLVIQGGAGSGLPAADPHAANPHGIAPDEEGMPAGHPPVDMGGGAGSHGMGEHGMGEHGMGEHGMGGGDEPNPHAADPMAAIDPATHIVGTISLAPALATMVRAGEVIYVTVKPVDSAGVVPAGAKALAVEQLHVGTWPLAFQLSAPAGTPVVVTARIDRDGDGMTRESGDLEGLARTTIPARDLAIVVDTPIR